MAGQLEPGRPQEQGSHPVDTSSVGRGGEAADAPGRGNAGRQQGSAAYDSVRSSQLESGARLRHLIDNIYAQHGLPPVMQAPGALHASRLQKPSMSWAHILFSTRYLVLELWNFEDVYNAHYKGIVGGLDMADKRGIHMIISGHEGVKGGLNDLRDKCVAHIELDFSEFAKRIDAIGLAPIVQYARAVVMFQDAVFRTVKNRHRKEGEPRGGIPISLELPSVTDRRAFEEKYGQMDFEACANRHRHECDVMQSLQMSLNMLYASFYEAALQSRYRNRNEFSRLDMQVYGARYMILDIHNFMVEFGKLDINKSTRPGFLHRDALYTRLRNNYAAHTYIDKIDGIGGLLEDRPGLLGDMLLDIMEIDVLASRVLERHPETLIKGITRMTPGQISEIDRRLRKVQVASHETYGNRYADFGIRTKSQETHGRENFVPGKE